MRLPHELRLALEALRSAGGRPRLAGGCVRDWLLDIPPKDFDIEVFGLNYETMGRALAPFGATDLVGRSFGTIKLRANGTEFDFSLPRRESKTGAGHRGFSIAPDPNLTDADAAARRDFTINSISYDPFGDCVIDPHGGAADLKKKILRHTSDAFAEDPLRVLRGVQLAARFDLTMATETVALCRSIRDSYKELAVERVWNEWDKWATLASKPSAGMVVLRETKWIILFNELAAIENVPQDPEWHPEGDVLTHTEHCLDALAGLPAWRDGSAETKRILSFGVLTHDFGKAATTSQAIRRGRMRWISPGHEAAGGPLAETFLNRIGAPIDLINYVRPLVVQHLAHHRGPTEFRESTIRRLARKVSPASIDHLIAVMMADHLGRPPLVSEDSLARINQLRTIAQQLAVEHDAPKPMLLGRHLISLGLTPGPDFTPALEAAFESQLDGAFCDEAGALDWMKNYLRAHPSLVRHLDKNL